MPSSRAARPLRSCGALSGGLWLVSGVLLLTACGGSARAEARVGSDVESFEFDRPLGEEELAKEDSGERQHKQAMASLVQQDPGAAGGDYALLGARRDLRLAPNVTQASCQCLAVVLGPPETPGFTWQGPRPSTHPTNQIVIGLGSEGIACDQNPKGHVASYKGYTVEGDDVVVTVEIARAGRPITQGAILPRPEAGQIYVRPASGDVPFGRGLDGAPRCALKPAGAG